MTLAQRQRLLREVVNELSARGDLREALKVERVKLDMTAEARGTGPFAKPEWTLNGRFHALR